MQNNREVNDFEVLAQIYEDTIINGELAHYKKLVAETGLDKKYVSSNIDKLMDLCLINGDFKKDSNNKWVYCYFVSDEAMPIAKYNYEKLNEESLTLTKSKKD